MRVNKTKEKIYALLSEINEEILNYNGENLFDAGLLQSFQVIWLIGHLEDEFDIEIDVSDIIEDNFKSKEAIVHLVKRILISE